VYCTYITGSGPRRASAAERHCAPACKAGEMLWTSSLDRQNVERYRQLLETAIDEAERQRLTKLLAEERQKQKDASDPVRWR
jgi:hypothetical protein